MLTDRYGLELTTRSVAARDAYVAAVDRLLAAGAETEQAFAAVTALDPGFALSLAATLAHLDEFPRDAMVLAPATGVFGLYGFSGRLERERELLALMDRLAANYVDDGGFPRSMRLHSANAGCLRRPTPAPSARSC